MNDETQAGLRQRIIQLWQSPGPKDEAVLKSLLAAYASMGRTTRVALDVEVCKIAVEVLKTDPSESDLVYEVLRIISLPHFQATYPIEVELFSIVGRHIRATKRGDILERAFGFVCKSMPRLSDKDKRCILSFRIDRIAIESLDPSRANEIRQAAMEVIRCIVTHIFFNRYDEEEALKPYISVVLDALCHGRAEDSGVVLNAMLAIALLSNKTWFHDAMRQRHGLARGLVELASVSKEEFILDTLPSFLSIFSEQDLVDAGILPMLKQMFAGVTKEKVEFCCSCVKSMLDVTGLLDFMLDDQEFFRALTESMLRCCLENKTDFLLWEGFDSLLNDIIARCDNDHQQRLLSRMNVPMSLMLIQSQLEECRVSDSIRILDHIVGFKLCMKSALEFTDDRFRVAVTRGSILNQLWRVLEDQPRLQTDWSILLTMSISDLYTPERYLKGKNNMDYAQSGNILVYRRLQYIRTMTYLLSPFVLYRNVSHKRIWLHRDLWILFTKYYVPLA